MPRLPDRVVSRMQPTSTLGSRLGKAELTDASVTEARAVAKQAIDAVSSSEALSVLATRLAGESISAPLSSMRDLPAGSRWVFDHPFFLLLNVAVGGNWPGPPDATTVFPQQMLVDYVRVYRR